MVSGASGGDEAGGAGPDTRPAPRTAVRRPASANQQGGGTAPGSPPFDEETYLRFNPDVRAAVAAGAFRSGREHYERYGRAEGRPFKQLDPLQRDRVIISGAATAMREVPRAVLSSVDVIRLSPSGGLFIRGWVSDQVDTLDSIDLYFGSWAISFDARSLARVRREDAETALKISPRHPFGFWGFITAGQALPGGQCSVVIRLKSGNESGFIIQAEMTEDLEMRDVVLAQIANAGYFGNAHFDAAASIDTAIGQQIVAFNAQVVARAVSAPYIERFGQRRQAYRGSFVICLYGRPEYLFLQSAMFARLKGIEDYEFIYVCNSPEIGEPLLKEARLAQHIYGLDQTVLVLNSNAGFGAANNVGAKHARSDRVLICNPDVFPYDADWAERHTALLEALPPAQSRLFGAPLYYDDGSLMHGGMYFDVDRLPEFGAPGRSGMNLLRVEHYGKGAPPDTQKFLNSRPVPAVSGAFMSVAKPWFETLGGFNEDYVFGHYEDADLCLKSLQGGSAPWLHDAKLWHLEGKGSTRRPEHEGGSILNRWLFTRKWRETIMSGLLGPDPAHGAFHQPTALPGARAAMAGPRPVLRKAGA